MKRILTLAAAATSMACSAMNAPYRTSPFLHDDWPKTIEELEEKQRR